MNILERQMVDLLKDLRDHHDVVDVKTEFETEAARLNEVMRLRDIVGRSGLGLVIKTGGPEAVRDMYDAMLVGVSGIVAPMVESAYALKKYLMAIEKFIPGELKDSIKFGINVETVQAYKNFSDFLKVKGVERLFRITVGRTDMVGSLGLEKDEINVEQVFVITREIFKKSKEKGFETTLGGGMAKESIPFIKRLAAENLLDRFETRKIVFQVPKKIDEKLIAEGLLKGNKFELMWLENKRNYYTHISREDEDRIPGLKKRIAHTG